LSCKYPVLFRRHATNPILGASQWPYCIHTAFNPGATRLRDGRTLLLCRCEDRRGFSHLCKAISENGIDNWVIDSEPTFLPDVANHPEELWGVEDPRITYFPERDDYIVTYTSFSKGGPGVSIATTKDFVTFERGGFIMQPDDKDAALLPRKFNDNYVLIHRPATATSAEIYISYSPDLKNWGNHKLLLRARRGGWWDANKIGLSPPLIETPEGWLMLYHGVRRHASGSLYRTGAALFDLENPEICLLRSQSWILGPEESYERHGDVGYVVFACGYTIGDDGDTINLYYGAADSCIGLAQGSIQEILAWLKKDGTTYTGSFGSQVEQDIIGAS